MCILQNDAAAIYGIFDFILVPDNIHQQIGHFSLALCVINCVGDIKAILTVHEYSTCHESFERSV